MLDKNSKRGEFKGKQKQCRLCGNYVSYAMNMFSFTVKLPDCGNINNDFAFRSVSLAQLVEECLNIDVQDTTSLPVDSCKKCCNQLLSWYRFKYGCFKQQSRFKEKEFTKAGEEITESVLHDENKDQMNVAPECLPEIDNSVHNYKDSNGKNGVNQLQNEEMPKNSFLNNIFLKENISKCHNKNLSDEKFSQCYEKSNSVVTIVKKIKANENKNQICKNKLNEHIKHKKGRKNHGKVSTNCYSLKHAAEKENSSMSMKSTEKTNGVNCNNGLPPVRKKLKNKINVKNLSDEIFPCDKCSKTFRSKFSIRKHLKTHTEDRRYCCHVCGLLFKSESSLRSHDILHSGIRKFPCPHCPKTFSCSNHQKQHVRIHTGEKPYQCKECEQKFARSSQLTQHVWEVHRKDKKYKCDICGKGFFVKFNFNAHMMGHSGQKNEKCDLCEKAFVTKNALFRHKRQHTGEKPFACEVCGERFADCSNRKKHMVNRHSDMNSMNEAVKSKSNSSGERMIIVPNEVVSENYSAKNKNASASNTFFEATLNFSTNKVSDSKTDKKFVKGSDLTNGNNKIHLNFSNLPIIDLSAMKDSKNDMQLTVVPIKNSEYDEEVAKMPGLYSCNGSVKHDLTCKSRVSEVVEEILFSDDLKIFNLLNLPQNIAYFIPDKEIFNQTDMLTENTLENVAFNAIDIDSTYLDVVSSQQKVDELSTIVPCEAQSVIKIVSNEEAVLLLTEQDNFSQIYEVS